MTVSSHLVYAASYTVEGPMFAGTFDLGAFSGPTTETEVTVRQVRGVRTS